jgi:hypothetical protein
MVSATSNEDRRRQTWLLAVQNVRSIYRIKFAACRVKTESGLYARPISKKTGRDRVCDKAVALI